MGIEINWLGHSTVVLDMDGVRLVADPLLRANAGILRRRGSRPDEDAWAGTDAVLLSHLHHDHAELASLRRVRGAPVLTARENADWVRRRRGLKSLDVDAASWTHVGQAQTVGVKLAPAMHQARPMPHRPNAASGHLVRGLSGIVWVAGDTELFPGLEDLPASAGGAIDVAVVPVGGWAPRLSKGHMGPREAAIACRMVGARYAIPVHWGTLHVPGGEVWPRGWMDSPGPTFAHWLGLEAPNCRPVVLAIGESVAINDLE